MSFLRRQQFETAFFSNAPDAIYILTGRVGHSSPRKTGSGSKLTIAQMELDRIKSVLLSQGSGYLVWFEPNSREYLFEPEELRAFFKLELLTKLSDGAIYSIWPGPE